MENKREIFTLDDGSNYIVADKTVINNTNYIYLVNEVDSTDFLFQRISYQTNPPDISPIESDEEFNMVLNHFGEKYKDLLED